MAIVKVDNLTVIYLGKDNQQYPALTDFTCTFDENCVIGVLGDSGSGKTTLFKSICNLLQYDGDIYFDDVKTINIKPKDRSLSYFTQEMFMFEYMIVYDILAYSLKREKYKADEIDKMIKEIALEFGINNLLTRKPNQLSVGQKQLVLMAKSLIKKPALCFLDEPFSNLDIESKHMIISYLKEYMKKNKTTIFITTHNLEDINKVCKYVCFIKDGKCVYYGDTNKLPRSLIYGIETK